MFTLHHAITDTVLGERATQADAEKLAIKLSSNTVYRIVVKQDGVEVAVARRGKIDRDGISYSIQAATPQDAVSAFVAWLEHEASAQVNGKMLARTQRQKTILDEVAKAFTAAAEFWRTVKIELAVKIEPRPTAAPVKPARKRKA